MGDPPPSFPEFVRIWHGIVTKNRLGHIANSSKHLGPPTRSWVPEYLWIKTGTYFTHSCDSHFAPQIEHCELSHPNALSKYNYVLRYSSPLQLANDTLEMLGNLGLSSYYYRMGVRRKEEMFGRMAHPTDANEKLRQFYDKETALLAWDILERDYHILGFDFPFPEWLPSSKNKLAFLGKQGM